MKNLEQEQARMRERQPARPGAVAGLRRERAEVGSPEEFRKFLRAHSLLSMGWSLSRVAAEVTLDYQRLKRWNDEHRPLDFNY
jgi:hypothetical protein